VTFFGSELVGFRGSRPPSGTMTNPHSASAASRRAGAVGGDVIADRANVVAVLPVAGDDADVGHACVVELIDVAVSVGDVSDFPVLESASSHREMDLLG
jgi:hypothetical protein